MVKRWNKLSGKGSGKAVMPAPYDQGEGGAGGGAGAAYGDSNEAQYGSEPVDAPGDADEGGTSVMQV